MRGITVTSSLPSAERRPSFGFGVEMTFEAYRIVPME